MLNFQQPTYAPTNPYDRNIKQSVLKREQGNSNWSKDQVEHYQLMPYSNHRNLLSPSNKIWKIIDPNN